MSDADLRSTDDHAARGVVVFALDGTRPDVLDSARTPHLDALAAQGFLTTFELPEGEPTISGPAWSTVASGVFPDKHRVFDNDLTGHQLHRFPDFLTRARSHAPAARTFAGAVWPPLLTSAAGGPVFADGGYAPELTDWSAADELVADEAARSLGHGPCAVAFVYFGETDHVGHALGLSDRYRRAVEDSDDRVGRVIDAIHRRPGHAEEEWTFIALTDHGHRDEGGHGGDSIQERRAWIIAAGLDIPSAAPVGVGHTSVHPQIMHALRIPIDPHWDLDGRSITELGLRPVADD
jgi:predicted AlkP superfamily pyrophosphatase or phosphodiesterase